MRFALPVFALMLSLAGPMLAQQTLPDLAQQGYDLYLQGNVEAARNVFEALLADGVRDSAIYFNLGRAYFDLRDSGRALLNYRRAHDLTPRDPDVNEALAQVRSSRVDILGDETGLIDSLALLTAGILTVEELGWMVLALWAIFFGAAWVYVVRADWQGNLRVPLVTLLAVLLVGLALLGSRLYVTHVRPAAVVIEAVVPAMSGPGEGYLHIYDLHAAAELRIL